MNYQTSLFRQIGNIALAMSIFCLSGCDRFASEDNEILRGTWRSTNEQYPATLVFRSDDWLFMAGDRSPIALITKYQINTRTKPMQLELNVPNVQKKNSMAFEFTGDRQLRIEFDDPKAGNASPKAFSAKAIVFKKVSDSTEFPTNTKKLDGF